MYLNSFIIRYKEICNTKQGDKKYSNNIRTSINKIKLKLYYN